LAIADHIAVMKHGQVHALLDPEDSDLEEIADIIVRGRQGPAMVGTAAEYADHEMDREATMRYLLKTKKDKGDQT